MGICSSFKYEKAAYPGAPVPMTVGLLPVMFMLIFDFGGEWCESRFSGGEMFPVRSSVLVNEKRAVVTVYAGPCVADNGETMLYS